MSGLGLALADTRASLSEPSPLSLVLITVSVSAVDALAALRIKITNGWFDADVSCINNVSLRRRRTTDCIVCSGNVYSYQSTFNNLAPFYEIVVPLNADTVVSEALDLQSLDHTVRGSFRDDEAC